MRNLPQFIVEQMFALFSPSLPSSFSTFLSPILILRPPPSPCRAACNKSPSRGA